MSVNKVNSDGSLLRVAGGTLYADSPIGTIVPYGGLDDKIPSGWLKCNGQAVSRTTYSELFAVIGTSFGTGDGSTTFNVPDLRETVPVGYGLNTENSSIVAHDSYAIGEFKDDQFQGHYHNAPWAVGSAGGTGGILGGSTPGPQLVREATSDGTNGDPRIGTTTHGKQLGVNYIIKAKQVAVPADFTDYVKDFIKSELVQINVPAQTGVGEYSVTKTLTIPTGYKFLAFGSVSCVHYNQVIMSALFDDNTNVATIRIYNDYGNIIALDNAVKVWVLYAKV